MEKEKDQSHCRKDNGYLYKGKIRAKRSEIYEILDPGSTWDKMLNLGNKEDAASREITKVYEDINETYDKLYELAGEKYDTILNILYPQGGKPINTKKLKDFIIQKI